MNQSIGASIQQLRHRRGVGQADLDKTIALIGEYLKPGADRGCKYEDHEK